MRPEKIWLDELEDGHGRSSREIVAERVYVGHDHAGTSSSSAPGARIVALEQNLARARAEDRWDQGARVKVGWQPEHCLVLR